MKPSINIITIILFFFCIKIVVYPQNTPPAFPRLEPDPKALEYYRLGRQNSGYSWTELAEISLWASTGEPSLTGMERIRAAVETLKNSPNLPASGREKAEFILDFMHSNFLRSYSLYQTRVDTIFTNGRFNCVSSAVLYVILCESSGINTSGVITRDHALVTVHVNGEDIDVETTNRYGFDPGSRRDFHDQFGRLTGFTYVPARNYRDRQTIGKIELISLILNNRIAELERANRYAEAVPLAVDRTTLLFGNALAVNTAENASASLFEDPRKNLMDRLLNYGAALLRANREEDCLNWTVIASSRFPDIERWQELSMAAVNNRIARFIRESRTDNARNFLESHRTLLTDSGYAQLNGVLLDSELLRRANQISAAADGEAVVSAIEQARNSGALAERRAVELITFAVLKTASLYAPSRNWREAIRYLESALARFGVNRDMEQALQTYRGNLAADYHNRFAAEWNRRNYDEAELILNEALAEFPNNRQLLSDRETVNRRRN